jgi:hypothetical protein
MTEFFGSRELENSIDDRVFYVSGARNSVDDRVFYVSGTRNAVDDRVFYVSELETRWTTAFSMFRNSKRDGRLRFSMFRELENAVDHRVFHVT